ncbi:MAG: DUF1611 domain-containing protein [Pseudomonadota bacterium]
MSETSLKQPYALYVGNVSATSFAKTGIGIAHWRPEWCVGQIRDTDDAVDLGLPDLTPAEAAERGAKTMVIGVVNHGGYIDPVWVPTLAAALDAGLDLANGLHARLTSIDVLATKAVKHGRALHDVRHHDEPLAVGTGRPRAGRRMLTVGTDCAVGKMFTTFGMARAFEARQHSARFVATGQTGVLIAGSGICVDAVASDFISGAAEALSPAQEDQDHWDLIEGQGSLFHPSFAGVTLGLVHGAQADALILCHNATREHMMGLPGRPMPTLSSCIEAYEREARLTAPKSRVVGISLNTSAMDEASARDLVARTADEFGMPCVDTGRDGADVLVDAVLASG